MKCSHFNISQKIIKKKTDKTFTSNFGLKMTDKVEIFCELNLFDNEIYMNQESFD